MVKPETRSLCEIDDEFLSNDIRELRARMDIIVEKKIREVMAAEEQIIRRLLSRWVSGLNPAVARDHNGSIIGLCDADAPIGSSPFILRTEDRITFRLR